MRPRNMSNAGICLLNTISGFPVQMSGPLNLSGSETWGFEQKMQGKS